MCVCVLQTCIVTHESNGIDIITALILNDISPLCRYRMEMVLELKVNTACRGPCGSITPPVGGHTWLSDCFFLFPGCQDNASKLLLALMESRHDNENAERILFNLRPRELVRAEPVQQDA